MNEQAVNDLINDIQATLADFKVDANHQNFFYGAAGLLICSRLLQAIEDRIDNGYSDLIAGDLRLVYENWILGHLLLLSDDDEISRHRGESRTRAQEALKDYEVDPEFAPEFPDAKPPSNTWNLASELTKKLHSHDPKNERMPLLTYERLFRAESFLGAHPIISSFDQYYSQKTDGLSVPTKKNAIDRLWVAATLVLYFATQVYTELGLDTKKLDGLEQVFSKQD